MKIIKCKTGNIYMTLKEIEDVSEKEIKANSVEAAVEKHIPVLMKKDEKVEVRVNHVMEENHYIEWILVDYGDKEIIKHFNPGDEPVIEVDYQDGMKAYSYCNLHSLWVSADINEKE